MNAGRLAKLFQERVRAVTRELAEFALTLDKLFWGWLVRKKQRAL